MTTRTRNLILIAVAALFITAMVLTAPKANAAPACIYEDGSSQARCVWDAKHMGNGEGRSVLIINGGTDNAKIKYISHKKAHRLLKKSGYDFR